MKKYYSFNVKYSLYEESPNAKMYQVNFYAQLWRKITTLSCVNREFIRNGDIDVCGISKIAGSIPFFEF